MVSASALALLVAAGAAAEPNETNCRALGFAPSLLCSSCSKLAEHVGKEDALVGECEGCCNEDSSALGVFASAHMDVCK